MTRDHEALQLLDQAISEFLTTSVNSGDVLTGWVLTGSVKHPQMFSSDGYFTQSSSGLPYHSQLGLLTAALEEKKNLVLINTWKEEKE
jgi:hypothetical protein